MRNLKIGSKKSIMSQKWSKMSKNTGCEKSNGASGNKNELVSSHSLREWTKTKNSLVLEFWFDSLFEKFFWFFLANSAYNCSLDNIMLSSDIDAVIFKKSLPVISEMSDSAYSTCAAKPWSWRIQWWVKLWFDTLDNSHHFLSGRRIWNPL